MARLGMAGGDWGMGTSGVEATSSSDLSEELKSWPDDRLDGELESAIYAENSPVPVQGPRAPGYLIVAEKNRRNDLRARGAGGGEVPPGSTIAEEMLTGGQMPPGMPPGMQQGMPPGMPPGGEDPMQFLASLQGGPQGMSPGMPQGMPQGMPPGMPQGMPPGMPPGMAGGGPPVPRNIIDMINSQEPQSPMMMRQGGLVRGYNQGGLVQEEEIAIAQAILADVSASPEAKLQAEMVLANASPRIRGGVGGGYGPTPGQAANRQAISDAICAAGSYSPSPTSQQQPLGMVPPGVPPVVPGTPPMGPPTVPPQVAPPAMMSGMPPPAPTPSSSISRIISINLIWSCVVAPSSIFLYLD